MKRTLAYILPCVVLLSGCASGGGLVFDPGTYGSHSAEVAVRTFLDAAKEEDYARMGRVFGTRRGPAEERLGITEVEQRMVVLARILRHGGYRLREADLAQLGPNKTRFLAEMRGTRRGSVQVPVVAVHSESGRWFVERIEVDSLVEGR